MKDCVNRSFSVGWHVPDSAYSVMRGLYPRVESRSHKMTLAPFSILNFLVSPVTFHIPVKPWNILPFSGDVKHIVVLDDGLSGDVV